MTITLLIISIIFLIGGIVGCIIPALPGPPLTYAALILLKVAYPSTSISIAWLIFWGIITGLVLALDYVLPLFGAKAYGATKYGIWGGIAGMIIGLIFFPPFGMILGLLVGTIAGELYAGSHHVTAIKAGIASSAISIAMLMLKMLVSLFIAVVYILSFI